MSTAPGVPPVDAPPSASADLAREVLALLSGHGFSGPDLGERLGVLAPRELRGRGLGRLSQRSGERPSLVLLARLFLSGERVPREDADMLGDGARDLLAAAGLVVAEGAALRATVQLVPFEGLLVAADRRERHDAGAADFVLGPGPTTQGLADLAIRRPVGDTLDLGCGAGALACLAARWSDRVVGADLNERAIAFARFNAALNGVDNVEFVAGDLYAPVAGRRFDRVLCNPPYVVSPASDYLYRDGEPGICARVVAGAPAHLAPGGTLQMVANWPQRRGRDWREDLRAELVAEGCDRWVLARTALEPLRYAAAWLSQQRLEEAALARALDDWLAFYDQEGIETIGQGLVVVHRADGREPWCELREAPPQLGAAGESIAGVLEARDRLARAGDLDALPGMVLAPAAGLERRTRQRPGTDGWQGVADELRLREGFTFAARLDPVAMGLFGFMDGRRSAEAATRAFAASEGIAAEPLLAGLPELVARLMWLGLLRPASGVGRPAAAEASGPAGADAAAEREHPPSGAASVRDA